MDISPPADSLTAASLRKLLYNHQSRTPQRNTVAVMDLETEILPLCIKQLKQRFTQKQSIKEFIRQSTQAIVSFTTCIVFIYCMYYLLPWLYVRVPELLIWLCGLFNYENFDNVSQYATGKLDAFFKAVGNFFAYIQNAIVEFPWPTWPTPWGFIDWLHSYCPERVCPPENKQEQNVIWNLILVILVLVLFLFLVILSLFTFNQVKASMPGWPKWLSRTQASDSKKETKVSEPSKPWISEATCTFIREAFSRTLYFLFTWTFTGCMIIFKFKFDPETTTFDDCNEIVIMLIQTVADAARKQRLAQNSIVTYNDWAQRKQKTYDTLAPTGKSQLYRKVLDFIRDPPQPVQDVLLQFILHNQHTFKKVLNACISVCSNARTESKSWNTRMVQGIWVFTLIVTGYVFIQPVASLQTMEGPFDLEGHYTLENCKSSSYFVTPEFAAVWQNHSAIADDCQDKFNSQNKERTNCYGEACEFSPWAPVTWTDSCSEHYTSTLANTEHSVKCNQAHPVQTVDDCVKNKRKVLIETHSEHFVCNDRNISAETLVPVCVCFALIIYIMSCSVVLLLWLLKRAFM